MAQKQIQKLKALDTTGQFLDSTMAWVAECRGDFEEAVSHMERAVKKNPANAQYLASLGFYSAMVEDGTERRRFCGSSMGCPSTRSGSRSTLRRFMRG